MRIARGMRLLKAGGRGAALTGMAAAILLLWEALLIVGPSNPVRRFVDNAELALYDGHMRILPPRKPDSRIVIVGMDDETLLNLPDLERPYYPLPRSYHARLVDELFAAGAKVIGFDIMFTLPREVPEEDGIFAAALQRHGNVVAALTPTVRLTNGVEEATFAPPARWLRPHLFAASILLPGQRVRWYDPYQPDDAVAGVRYQHFGLAVDAAYHNETGAVADLRDTFHWGNHIDAPVVTVSNREQVLIRYLGPGGTFDVKPFYEVYDRKTWRTKYPDRFRGKIVLVGRVSELEDQHDTPLGQMSGVEILATIADNALNHDYLKGASPQNSMAVAAVLMAVYIFVLWRFTLAPAALTAGLLALVWGAFIPRYVFVHDRVWIETLPPLLCLGMLLAATAVYETARMRGQFHQFMPSWVADRVLTGAGAGTTGNETIARPVTVVFCDIRNFTNLSEERPNESVELLRRFFDAADSAARRQGTELDKYIGDEIMLYFFERRNLEPHALRAVRWAIEMLQSVKRIDASGLAGDIGFRVGIGIATGVAREGFVGVRKRVQSTVIGDVVNLASRLQEATKSLHRPILMNEQTFSQVASVIPVEPLGAISVRGKQEAVAVFTLRGIQDAEEQSDDLESMGQNSDEIHKLSNQ